MPIFNKDHLKYYKTRNEVLKIFRNEEKKNVIAPWRFGLALPINALVATVREDEPVQRT